MTTMCCHPSLSPDDNDNALSFTLTLTHLMMTTTHNNHNNTMMWHQCWHNYNDGEDNDVNATSMSMQPQWWWQRPRHLVFKSLVWSGFLAPKQHNRTRTSPRKFPRLGNWQLDWKKLVLNGPYISCNQLQRVFWKTGPQLGYVWKSRLEI